jgi:hypothetical protein
MLEGVEREVGQSRDVVPRGVDPEHSALVAWSLALVEVRHTLENTHALGVHPGSDEFLRSARSLLCQEAKGAVLPPRPISEQDTAVMTLATITRADVPAACERLRALVGASDADVVVCDVGSLAADLVTIEALARLRLTARRLGCGLRLRRATRALAEMVAFCGLCDVLPVEDGLLRGLRGNGGQPEERKQPVRVEERVEGRDPPV